MQEQAQPRKAKQGLMLVRTMILLLLGLISLTVVSWFSIASLNEPKETVLGSMLKENENRGEQNTDRKMKKQRLCLWKTRP